MEGSQGAWNPGSEMGAWQRMLLALELLGLYVGVATFPLNLSFFRSVTIPQGFFESGVLLGILALALLATLARLFWHHQRAVSYGVLWFLVSIMPVLNLTSLNLPIMEHWLYLPAIGFAFAIVACLHYFAQRLGEIRGAAFGCALLILLLSARTVSRNAEWGDPINLFLNDTRLYPKEEKNWFLLGYAYFERGMADQAVRAYEAGLAVNPNHAYAWSGLGEALSMAESSWGDSEREESGLRWPLEPPGDYGRPGNTRA